MANYNKWLKNRTVVGASEVLVAGDYGILGCLELGYMLIYMSDGVQHAMPCPEFASKYTVSNTVDTLQGEDWD